MKKILSALAIALMFVLPANAFAMQGASSTNTKGVDVSHWDGNINWTSVKNSGVTFTYVKAAGTTGNPTYKDPMFATNIAGAHAAGLSVGAYYFAAPLAPYSPLQAAKQADFFVKTMTGVMPWGYGDMMPVLDFEVNGSLTATEQVAWVKEFSAVVKAETGRNVMLYTSDYFIQTNGNLNNALSDMSLWVAYYSYMNNNTNPTNAGGFTNWLLWQHTDKGTVPGINVTDVDLDYGPSDLSTTRGILTQADQLKASNDALSALIGQN